MTGNSRSGRRKELAAFGTAVRLFRKQAGLTQEELGRRCGLDRTYISGIERGVRNPTLRVIWRLAEALESTPSRLIEAPESGALK